MHGPVVKPVRVAQVGQCRVEVSPCKQTKRHRRIACRLEIDGAVANIQSAFRAAFQGRDTCQQWRWIRFPGLTGFSTQNHFEILGQRQLFTNLTRRPRGFVCADSKAHAIRAKLFKCFEYACVWPGVGRRILRVHIQKVRKHLLTKHFIRAASRVQNAPYQGLDPIADKGDDCRQIKRRATDRPECLVGCKLQVRCAVNERSVEIENYRIYIWHAVVYPAPPPDAK